MLVLSEFAGAHEELGADAVSVDPTATGAFADAIHRALTLDPAERRERTADLRRTVADYDLSAWLHDVLETASARRRFREGESVAPAAERVPN